MIVRVSIAGRDAPLDRRDACPTHFRGGFTLVEVVLAVFIAVGLLMVAMSFYQQSARLRGDLLQESERLATLRLLMDRMTSDLRTALPEPRTGFTGGSDFMRFIHSDPKGLLMVSYEAAFGGDATNATMIGFNRVERLALETATIATTNIVPFSFSGDDLFLTNQIAVAEPLTRAIRHAQFRYYDGFAWVESWDSVDLPVGVEISLGFEPISTNELSTNEMEFPAEVFRRVVALPAGRASSAATNEFGVGGEAMEGFEPL